VLKNPLLIVWTDKNKLNIPIIDEQHRAMVSIINSLHYFIRNGSPYHVLLPIIIMLEQHAIIHFETEQMLLKKYNYPNYDEHYLLHAHLRDNLSAIKAQSFLNKDPDTIAGFLKDWWINHINVEDRKYEKWFSSQQNLI